MNKRNLAIDSLEGIGMLFIIFVHFSQAFNMEQFTVLAIFGARSVQLLFIACGFLTVKSLRSVYNNKISLGKWYLKKLVRIYPVYWFFLTVFIACSLSGVINTNTDKWSTLGIVSCYLGLNGLWPYYINLLNLSWFMGDVILWYMIAPVILKKIDNVAGTLNVTIIYLFVYIVGAAVLNRQIENAVVREYLTYQWLPAQLPYLLMGALIYQLYRKFHEVKFNKASLNLITLVLVIIFASFTRPAFLNNLFDENMLGIRLANEYVTWGILFAILFAVQLLKPWKILVNRVFSLWGKNSFGVYLSHFILIRAINLYMKRNEIARSLQLNALIYVLVCLTSLGIAILVENGLTCLIGKIGVKCTSIGRKGE